MIFLSNIDCPSILVTGNATFSSSITQGSVISSMLKANGSGTLVAAVAGDITDLISGTYLPLSGGTLTGALSGTSAAFSGAVNSTSAIVVNASGRTTNFQDLIRAINTSGDFLLTVEGSAAGTRFTGSTAYASVLGTNTSTDLQFGTNNIVRVTLNSSALTSTVPISGTSLSMSGAGSFGGNVDVTKSNSVLTLQSTNSGGYAVTRYMSSGVNDLWFGRESSTSSVFGLTASASVVYSEGAYPYIIFVNGAERSRVSPAGNTLIKTTTDNGTDALQVAGSGLFTGQLNTADIVATASVFQPLTLRRATNTVNLAVEMPFQFLNASSAYETYSHIRSYIVANTASAVSGGLRFTTLNAGTQVQALQLDNTGAITASSSVSANYFDAIYAGALGNYNGKFDWDLLQLGNNGSNRIVAGHAVAGGWLDFYVNNTNNVVGTSPNGIHAMRLDPDGTARTYVGLISQNYVQSGNFRDTYGTNNVNLGNGGNEGRGLVAGYSGGNYGGIGHNIRHTGSSSSWIAPGGDNVSYLTFNAGFTFSFAPGGAAGRDISGTLGRIARLESWGDFKIKGALFPGYDNAASYSEQGSYYLYGNTSNQGICTNGNFLANGDIYSGTLGVWLSSWLNQDVRTSSRPTFLSVRADEGFTSASAQGRFGGWYNGVGFTGAAVEVGYSGGTGNVIAYNRNTATYSPIYLAGSEVHLTPQSGSIRATGNIVMSNYGLGLVGQYNSTLFQAVYAMGESYMLPGGGGSTGSLYGLAWAHPNAGGQAANLSSHGLLVVVNGTTVAAISSNIWISGSMTATNFYGIASNVAINYNNDSASTYQMLWGSGNSIYGTAGIYCNPSTDTIYANGNIIAYASSDSRYKDNQQLITNPIGKLLALRGMTFTWNNLQQDFKGDDYGLIYQDVVTVMPEITQMRANGYGAIKYEKVIPLLVEVGKNHEERIKELESKLQAYENKFGKLN